MNLKTRMVNVTAADRKKSGTHIAPFFALVVDDDTSKILIIYYLFVSYTLKRRVERRKQFGFTNVKHRDDMRLLVIMIDL